MLKNNRRSRGFTLAELLIVVAIVAVLTAIAVPVFAAQLESSREATDTANIRSNYAEVMAEAIETGKDVNTTGALSVQLKMKNPDQWDGSALQENLYNLASKDENGNPRIDNSPQVGGYAYVSYSKENGVVIHFSGGSSVNSGESIVEGESTSEVAHQNNNTTAGSIGTKVLDLLKEKGSEPSTKVTIKVGTDGKVDVTVEGKKAHVSEDDVRSALGLSDGGTIAFDKNDTIFVNGYKVIITKNNSDNGHNNGNGNHTGGKIEIVPA